MENVEGVKKKSKRKESRYGKRYGFEFKLCCMKFEVEEGIPVSLLSKEVEASKESFVVGRRRIRNGEKRGLRNRFVFGGNRRRLPGPAREKIVGEWIWLTVVAPPT